ncbi:MAG: acyl-CoA dehydrogenase family protein, partial [bacterium]
MKSPYFSEEHELFRATAREFMQKEVVPFASQWEKEKRIPRALWKKMAELGFLGINFPEKYGGAGADFFYTVAFLEEVGHCALAGFTAAVLVQQYMATAHIERVGSEELKEKYLVPSIAGKKVGALGITEPNAGSDVAAIRTRAIRDGDHYVINGSKTFITNGVDGDFVTIAVKTDPEAGTEGISIIVVDTDTPGYSAKRLDKMGLHCSDTGELSFDDVRVPASNLIGQENMGFYYIMESFQLERLGAAITSFATTETCLEETLKYITEREAFGKPLAKFQVIRHALANLASELEAVKQLTYYTSWLYEQGEQAIRECSMAKMLATELSKKAADTCLQFFGGYGYMDEYPISRIFRDA